MPDRKRKRHVLLHHDWQHYTPSDAKRLPLYPRFEQASDGTLRSMFHYKDYEPTFEHYGLPPYIAGMNVSAIAYKTDKWNTAGSTIRFNSRVLWCSTET